MSRDDKMTSRDYEREAAASRHRLAGSLSELSDRLTPGQVFDEVLAYAKGGGGSFLSALSNAARDNPMPSMLISAGLMMFLSEKTGLTHMTHAKSDGRAQRGNGYRDDRYSGVDERYADNSRYGQSTGPGIGDRVSGAAHAVGDFVTGAAHAMGGAVRGAADTAMSGARRGAETAGAAVAGAADAARNAAASFGAAAGGIGAGVRDQADHLMHQAADMADGVRQNMAAAGDRFSRTAHDAPRRVGEGIGTARDSFNAFAGDQPLIMGAIGLAVGAIIAAALPRTEAEDQLMGETSDAVKDAVGALAVEEMTMAKEVTTKVAADVAENLSGVMEREGVSTDTAKAAVHDVADKVKQAVGMTPSGEATDRHDIKKADAKQY